MATRRPEARSGRSLRAQALGYLSRREHSRHELRIKLLAMLERRRADSESPAAPDRAMTETDELPLLSLLPADPAATDDPGTPDDPEAAVDAVLDWLTARGYLSDARFVESRLHARAARQGTLRIRAELARHGLVLDAGQAQQLRDTEFARAMAVWRRKFGTLATEPRGRAAQARFLAARGFTAEVVRRIVGGDDEEGG